MELETREVPLDILAERYASTPMVGIWSTRNKIRLERLLWVAALKAQRDLGSYISSEAIETYERSVGQIDLETIRERELALRHDVLARIEAFNVLAGCQLIHKSFTARDLTDNIEQLQILESLKLTRKHSAALLAHFGVNASKYQLMDMAGRSHNVAGQTITFGKRFANWAEEFLISFERLEITINSWLQSLRGIKGPMGTQQDLIQLLGGSKEKALEFEKRMMLHLGFEGVLSSVGQVYPRSLDFEVVTTLTQLASAPTNMAKTFRLMAGQALMYEGFAKEQKGSSAMPHKINARTCERICGLLDVMAGFVTMTQSLLGNQWNEGDVSCSVVRRVALPGAFFAHDGLQEATLTVLNEMGVFNEEIELELQSNLALLSSTRLLLAATSKGMGREDAHTLIRNSAVEAIKSGQAGKFIEYLLGDANFPLSRDEVMTQIAKPEHGASVEQIEKVLQRIADIRDKYPEAADYQPEPIR
jgi:adenylosuccinate lyase